MANVKENVSVAKPNVSGGVFWAPLGTTLPTDAVSPLGEEFKSWGYISEDGVSEAIERSTTPKKAWGGEKVKNITSEYSEKYTFTAIETNEEVLKGRYGDSNVTSSLGAISITHTDNDLERHVWVFEILMDDGRISRKVIGDGQIIETGEVPYKDGDVILYPMTMEAFKHEGAYVKEYIAKAE